MASENNTDSTNSGLERTLSIEELKVKYAGILNNPAVQEICMWRDPLDYLSDSNVQMTDEEYAAKAEASAATFVKLYDASNAYWLNGEKMEDINWTYLSQRARELRDDKSYSPKAKVLLPKFLTLLDGKRGDSYKI